MSDDINVRLEKLEEKLAFQDQTIEDLNQAITDQWTMIEKLKRELGRLTEEVQGLEQSADGKPQRDPPPPHY